MKKHNFTLVELLAVLVIMSILLAIVVPSFRSLTRGNAPDRAAREIMGRVAATRAYAAAKRVNTALIFAAGETGIPTSLQFSAYRSCEVIRNSSGNWEFARWIKGDSWTELPAGIMVGLPLGITTGSNRLLQAPTALTNITGATIAASDLTAEKAPLTKTTTGTSRAVSIASCDISDLPGSPSAVTMTNAIVFRSTGMVDQVCNIELREAQLVDGTIKPVTAASTNEFYTICVRQNGKCVYYPELQTYTTTP